MNTISVDQFREIGAEVVSEIPGYDLHQHQPLEALETGVGNCAAKAAIAAGILIVRHNVQSAFGWNVVKHGEVTTDFTPLGERETLRIVHNDLIAPTTPMEGTELTDDDLYVMQFGMKVPERVSGERIEGVPDFGPMNKYDQYATINRDGTISETKEIGSTGYIIRDWKSGLTRYLAAVQEVAPNYDQLLEEVEKRFND